MSHREQVPATLFQAGPGNQVLGIAIIVFMAIALYNAIELGVLIPLSFRRYHSLYFWALLTSARIGSYPSNSRPSISVLLTHTIMAVAALIQYRIRNDGPEPIRRPLLPPPSRLTESHCPPVHTMVNNGQPLLDRHPNNHS